MGGTFFDTFSAKEKQFFWQRTKILSRALEEWARGYSCLRPVRAPSVALLTAMISQHGDVLDAIGGGKIAFWIFAVDDLADERKISLADFLKKGKQWYLCARDGTGNNDESDELTAMLLEIRKDLSRFCLFEPLLDHWASCIPPLIETMAQEYQYGLLFNTEGTQALPSLDEYLSGGLHSIGMPLWASGVWITQSDLSILEHLELIDAATRHAGRAIRLYNDLQTLDREMREGNVNSVMIAYYKTLANQEISVENGFTEAKRYILQLADFFGHECRSIAKQIHTESGQVEKTLARTVAFNASFYGHGHDFHITSLDDVHTLLEIESA